MIRHTKLTHRFVKHIPDRLDAGVLYISIEYATAAHSCCCGCGAEVITPFTPTDWKMTFDGQSISLWPSIGNWYQPCRSHYVIDKGRIIEALPWNDRQILAEQQRDHDAKRDHYGQKPEIVDKPVFAAPKLDEHPQGWWSRLVRRLFG